MAPSLSTGSVCPVNLLSLSIELGTMLTQGKTAHSGLALRLRDFAARAASAVVVILLPNALTVERRNLWHKYTSFLAISYDRREFYQISEVKNKGYSILFMSAKYPA